MELLTLVKIHSGATDRNRFQPCSKIKILVLFCLKKGHFWDHFSTSTPVVFPKMSIVDFELRVLIGAASLLCGFTPPRSTSSISSSSSSSSSSMYVCMYVCMY